MLLRSMRCALLRGSIRLTSVFRVTDTSLYYHLGLATQCQQLGKSLSTRHFRSYYRYLIPGALCTLPPPRLVWQTPQVPREITKSAVILGQLTERCTVCPRALH